MTHASEIGAISRLHFPVSDFGASFSFHFIWNENFWYRK